MSTFGSKWTSHGWKNLICPEGQWYQHPSQRGWPPITFPRHKHSILITRTSFFCLRNWNFGAEFDFSSPPNFARVPQVPCWRTCRPPRSAPLGQGLAYGRGHPSCRGQHGEQKLVSISKAWNLKIPRRKSLGVCSPAVSAKPAHSLFLDLSHPSMFWNLWVFEEGGWPTHFVQHAAGTPGHCGKPWTWEPPWAARSASGGP